MQSMISQVTMNGRERVRFDPIKPGFLALKPGWLCEENILYSTGEKLRRYKGIYTVELDLR